MREIGGYIGEERKYRCNHTVKAVKCEFTCSFTHVKCGTTGATTKT